MRRIVVLAAMVGMGASVAAVAGAATETCTIKVADPMRTERAESRMELRWQRSDCKSEDQCNESNADMPWSRWSGVTAADLEREGAAVDARMRAEAGEMRCVGTVHGGALQGSYSFTPNAEFVRQMEAMGFRGETAVRLQGYAMLDVTTEWVKAMKAAGVQGMTSENLMGLRALKVDSGYVRGMAAAGYPELEAGKLTGMKAVGVSPEKVKQVRAMGFKPTQEELIQLSVFKIDAPFVERMKARGFQNLTIAQLVKIKIFKLDE